MNLLVYNFFDETTADLNSFLEKTNSSAYFALSISDLIRILKRNKIDIAILKFINPERELIEKIISISPQTKFYISSDKLKSFSRNNIHLFPLRSNLNSISKKIIKGA